MEQKTSSATTFISALIVAVSILLVGYATASPVTPAENKRFEGCKNKLKAAQKLDVLYDLDWKPPAEPRILAGATFFNLPIDAKEGFAETLNCFLMAGKTEYINFDILDWRTGKAVGRYSWGKFEMK